eukprot:8782486-Pyramimonas_sp.AAC.1
MPPPHLLPRLVLFYDSFCNTSAQPWSDDGLHVRSSRRIAAKHVQELVTYLRHHYFDLVSLLGTSFAYTFCMFIQKRVEVRVGRM